MDYLELFYDNSQSSQRYKWGNILEFQSLQVKINKEGWGRYISRQPSTSIILLDMIEDLVRPLTVKKYHFILFFISS